MKSKLFESLNDRQNIINAYSKMVNESMEEDELLSPPENTPHPVAVHDENFDDKWVSLDDFVDEKSAEAEQRSSEFADDANYYFTVAVDKFNIDELYGKIQKISPEYVPSGAEIARAGTTYSEKDLFNDIADIGKEYVAELHGDDIEVAIPDWAVTYIVNNDGSGISEEDKQMVDDYIKSVGEDGYSLEYSGGDLGFRASPEFGDATNCIRFYLVKDKDVANESTEEDTKKAAKKMTYSDFLSNCTACGGNWAAMLMTGIKKVFPDVWENLEDKKYSFDELLDILEENGVKLDEADADVDDGGETDESSEKWFDESGNLIKDIPYEAVMDCSQNMGADNEENCKMWVDKLNFDKNLDMSLAKGYLKATGAWDVDELKEMSDKDVAVRLLWIICCDLRENGKDYPIYIADYGRFDESAINEYTYKAYEVTISNIHWDDKDIETAYDKDFQLPSRDKMDVEVSDGENVDDVIKYVYIDSFGFAPKSFRIIKQKFLGERKDGVNEAEINDVTTQKDIVDMKRKNPDVKIISEEDGDMVGSIDADVDDYGIYHEYPNINHKLNTFRQKFRIKQDGSSKFDELAEELHNVLDGCTKGFFTDNQYEVVSEVMRRLESVGLFTTITKIENYGIRGSDGLRQGKRYFFDATWKNKFGKRMTVHGIIIISFAGTVDNPEEKYDACVTFFTDEGNYIKVDC